MHFRYFSSEQIFRRAMCIDDIRARSNARLPVEIVYAKREREVVCLFRHNYAECYAGITPQWSRKKHSLQFSLRCTRYLCTHVYSNARPFELSFVGQRVVDARERERACGWQKNRKKMSLGPDPSSGSVKWHIHTLCSNVVARKSETLYRTQV